MAILEPLVVAALQSLMSRPRQPMQARLGGLWLLVLSLLLSCAGVVYLLIALDTQLAASYGPVAAALGTAFAAFALAGAAVAAFLHLEKPRPRERLAEESMMEAGEALFAALQRATEGLEEPIANNPRASLMAAGLAGYMAGDKLH